MPTDHREQLRQIRSFPSLVKYLRDELDWPVESDSFDDLVFDYEPEELGIDAKTAAKIESIKQLRPLTGNQPWGIFFVKFEPKRLPVVALRRILGQLVFRKRASANKAERPAWNLHDLLFISAFGEGDDRQISLAHFSEDSQLGNLATLKVLGWDGDDTGLHLDHVHQELHDKLRWPADEEDVAAWRDGWSAAFTLRHREVITTAHDLAIALADLARKIRKKINAALSVETQKGKLRKLMKAFQESLIHDLDEDDFADMYAQTIAYGLLSASISRASGALVADDLALMASKTSPFLRELLETFLNLGGRRRTANGDALDFDELGINDVVDMLRAANMEAVLRNFGDEKPEEDPVIHFYELFLKEYDAKKRMQRGVFYTPKPVVSYIVRSVHELLQTEFGLVDGLADTTTWCEMAARAATPPVDAASSRVSEPTTALADETTSTEAMRQDAASTFVIPEGVSPDDPFVCILDPATGTATFLVEVIDVIHRTLVKKWRREGHGEKKIETLWNDYVPKHLLPRLHGYELLMAPYAIAHMKIGLKLAETGYRFGSDERARVYLTNALEPPPPRDRQMTFADWCPALAHEAQAVNAVKRNQCFTVVVGNPPYSGVSVNMSEHAQGLVDRYRSICGKRLEEVKLWLQNDYVKFTAFAQECLERSDAGVWGFITDNSYLDGPTFRGMRHNLAETFSPFGILDLHGSSKRRDRTDTGEADENVFDITQGVCIALAARHPRRRSCKPAYGDITGTREAKYALLLNGTFTFEALTWAPPFF
ncbi:MAG TPA: hypothetical protein DD670_15350, partial [Planctomycetaceae bacterium]|nr:hypothetical protein [Planctomycetaceae bacterium]